MNHEFLSMLEDECISLYSGSDFINLTKLTLLVLQKKKEENAKKESQKESTFGDWIWKTLKNIGEKLHVSGEANSKTRGIEEEITIKVYENKYILGYTILKYLWGFKGFKVESTEVESNIYDLIKDLSEEEWDWIEMDLKEVEAHTFMEPLKWNPKEDPRPDWKIEEI